MDLKEVVKNADWYELMIAIKERIEGEEIYVSDKLCKITDSNSELGKIIIYQIAREY